MENPSFPDILLLNLLCYCHGVHCQGSIWNMWKFWKGIPSFRDSVSGSMRDFPSNISQKPWQAQTLRIKAVSDDMVIVFNIHLGELQQLQYNLFRPKKVAVIHLFVALDNATKVSAKCNVLCCFSVIKYQLPNHQESTVKNLMPSLCKKN